jgi:hypothetical protein
MMTPKHLKHALRNSDYTDTTARLYMHVNAAEYAKFVAGFEEQETKDILAVLAGDGSGTGGYGYVDFLLHVAQQGFSENMQIHETLSDNYVAYFFGQAPPIFQYTGTLLNTFQDDWAMSMFRTYRDLARGSQLARHKKTIRLTYDSLMVTGAMSNFSWATTAEMPMACSFSFSLLVKEIRITLGGLTPPTKSAKLGAAIPNANAPADPADSAAVLTIAGTESGTPEGAATANSPLPTTQGLKSWAQIQAESTTASQDTGSTGTGVAALADIVREPTIYEIADRGQRDLTAEPLF